MLLRKILLKILYGNRATGKSYIKSLKKMGARIGERTTIYSPTTTLIDSTRPWLINIGNDVQITHGVTILTHGYDWSVLKGVYGEVLGSSGKVEIGNNVFIGMHSTILKGVKIGNNVIVAANSLVNKNIPDNCIIAGNPAKVIMSLEDYFIKRKSKQSIEAIELVKEYIKTYKNEPSKDKLSEFFWLFSDGNTDLPNSWKDKMNLVGNSVYSYQKLQENKKTYANIEQFIEIAKKTIEE